MAAYRRTHAQILLFTDEGELGPGLPDMERRTAELEAGSTDFSAIQPPVFCFDIARDRPFRCRAGS